MNENRGLLRGRRSDTKELIQGFYYCVTDNDTPQNVHNIITFERLTNGEIILTGAYTVDSSTLGVCTGKYDKYDTIVFEGDIIEFEGRYYEIIWDEQGAEFCACHYRNGETYYDDFKIVCKFGEVISNIYLAPELLKRQ